MTSPPAPDGSTEPRVGPFRVLAPLSKGGMARVDLARPVGGGDICVLKQLHGALESDDDAARRFAREAQLAALLDHPHIARLVGSGRDQGRLFIATELVHGVTFEQLNRRLWSEERRLPIPLALGLIVPVLEALAHAHALRDARGRPVGLVHRDLSSKNLMVDARGCVKIIDFGVAKGAVDDHRTATGMLMGTPMYMSPEQAAGLRVDRRSDLYTVGVVLWELLAGRRLVRAKGQAQMLVAVSRVPAPDLSDARPDVPAALRDVVHRALDKAPSGRFDDASAFLAALRRAAGRFEPARAADLAALIQSTMVERLAALERLLETVDRTETGRPAPTPARVPDARGSEPRPPPRRRSTGLAVLAAGALLVAAGWAARALSPGAPEAPERPPRPAAVAAPAMAPAAPIEANRPPATREAAGRVAKPPSPPRTARPRAARPDSTPAARPAPTPTSPPEAPAATSGPPSSAEAAELAELTALLARYRRLGRVPDAAALYGRLRARARGAAPAAERACVESVLGALDFIKYDDVDAAAPRFDEALDCLRHPGGL